MPNLRFYIVGLFVHFRCTIILLVNKNGGIKMENRRMTEGCMRAFAAYLDANEKAAATKEKYIRDVCRFADYASGQLLSKELLLRYKEDLIRTYAVRSANSMLASVNAFLRFKGWHDLCIKQFRLQKEVYCSEQKELTKQEYASLVRTAEGQNNRRLALVVQTICGTGIRVSELQCITVEAAKRGEAVVSCKGKIRKVFIVKTLQKKLLQYAKEQGILTGMLFITKTGKPLDRSNIWRQMKQLCKQAGVAPDKVFPHNLRHLFARVFYSLEKDIAKLADILGHSNINTTRIYIITTGAEHRRRLESMRLIL